METAQAGSSSQGAGPSGQSAYQPARKRRKTVNEDGLTQSTASAVRVNIEGNHLANDGPLQSVLRQGREDPGEDLAGLLDDDLAGLLDDDVMNFLVGE